MGSSSSGSCYTSSAEEGGTDDDEELSIRVNDLVPPVTRRAEYEMEWEEKPAFDEGFEVINWGASAHTRTKVSAPRAKLSGTERARASGAPLLDSRLPAAAQRTRCVPFAGHEMSSCRIESAQAQAPFDRAPTINCLFLSRVHYSQPCCGSTTEARRIVLTVNDCVYCDPGSYVPST